VRFWGTIRWILTVAFLPCAVLGMLVLAMWLYGWVRYDPAYFTEAYAERYSTSGAAAKALEEALRASDFSSLAELQGLRWPRKLSADPNLTFIMLWESTDRYTTYLYFDQETYERHLYDFEQVGKRWVMAPPDLYHTMRSGRWRDVFLPVAIAWWLLGGGGIGIVWLSRNSMRFRAWLFGDPRP
jgi:hypothetical protein